MNEKENTYRRLTEEPQLVTSFWCRFGFHNWTKYDEPIEWRHPCPTYPISQTIVNIIQERKCIHCNIVSKHILSRYKKK